MQKLYKVDIIKLVVATVSLTAIVIGGCFFAMCYLFKNNEGSVDELKDKIKGRLSQGIVEEKKDDNIKPEEAILQAVNVNRSRTVKIYDNKIEENSVVGDKNKKFLARGIILSSDGLIGTAKGAFNIDKTYAIIVPGQKDIIRINPIGIFDDIAFFKLDKNIGLIADLEDTQPQIGELVVAIGGREKDGMAVGEILQIEKNKDEKLVISNISPKMIEIGTPLINQNKKIIGIYLGGNDKGQTVFISGESIKDKMKKIK